MKNKDMLPIIGITTYGRDEAGRFNLYGEYLDAVRNAGGVPILLAPGEQHPERILEIVDGLIFAGGGDIDPALYGGNSHPSISRIDHERDEFEIKLVKNVLNSQIPVLGICRGIQLLNVATGGNLVEHLPEQFGNSILHRAENGDAIKHSVQITPGSKLEQIIGVNEFDVKSKHHQALRTIAESWRITAKAADGVIEALEHKTHPWMISVLWHPELSLDDPLQQKLFKALIEAAQNNKK